MFSVHFASMFVRFEGLPTNLVVSVWKTLWASSNRTFRSFPKTVSDRIFQISGVKSDVFSNLFLGGGVVSKFFDQLKSRVPELLVTDNMRFRLQHSNIFELKCMLTLFREYHVLGVKR